MTTHTPTTKSSSYVRPFRLGSYPPPGTGNPDVNPYIDLFYRSLAPYGVDCQAFSINDAWLRANCRSLNGVHFHWPEDIWRGRGKTFLGRLRGVWGLRKFLRLAGQYGIKRIWTVHDVEHHEGSSWIDRLGYQTLAKNCDLLICHSKETAERIHERNHPSCPVIVMPHGNYGSTYPVPRSRIQVLKSLELNPDLPVFCCLGFLRAYKGLDIACEAVTQLKGRVQLVLGGKPCPGFSLEELRHSIQGTPYIRLIDRHLVDQEFADIVGASEAFLLPYRKITGSGALLAALTLGRGVIASDLPYFRELLSPEPEAGVLFSTGQSTALSQAIVEYLLIGPERRCQSALTLSHRYSWEECVRPVAAVFQEWRRTGSATNN